MKGKEHGLVFVEMVVPRRMEHLHERISTETALTEEIVTMFTVRKGKYYD